MRSFKSNVDKNKLKGETFQVLSATCDTETNHVAAQSIDKSERKNTQCGPNEDDTNSIEWRDHYQIVQCLGCDTFLFPHKHWFSEAQDYYGPDNYDDGTTTVLYPQRSKDILKSKVFHHAPKNLEAI